LKFGYLFTYVIHISKLINPLLLSLYLMDEDICKPITKRLIDNVYHWFLALLYSTLSVIYVV